MTDRKIPFNLSLYNPGAALLRRFGRVFATDTYEGSTRNFHPGGLYSAMIFGTPGTPIRKRRFGVIDMKVNVFHPVIYDSLVGMREFYGEIMSGRGFAKWDTQENDFVKATALDGQTGFGFFIKYWRKIKFDPRGSTQREVSIGLIRKYESIALVQYLVVLPAALRDLEVDETGRATSDEINSLYYTAIATSRGIVDGMGGADDNIYDRARWRLQQTFNQIYDTCFTVLDGKRGLINGKVTARSVHDATRTVISAMPHTITDLGSVDSPRLNNVAVGLHQVMKSLRLVTRFMIKNSFIKTVFTTDYQPAKLTDKKTLKSVEQKVSRAAFDKWNTDAGLEKLFEVYADPSIRHTAIDVDGFYLGLLYTGPDGTFKLIHGIDELPEGRDPKDCQPLTLTHVFYAAVYMLAKKYPLTTVRYPIIGVNSVFPAMIFLETTTKYERRTELGDDWNPIKDRVAIRFPITGVSFYDSLSPRPERLAGLDGDHDGDQVTNIAIVTKEAIMECVSLMRKREHYVGTDGRFRFNLDLDTTVYTASALSKVPKKA